MQQVAVGASNVQIRRNGTIKRNYVIRFSVKIMCCIPLTVYYILYSIYPYTDYLYGVYVY